jgi:hypothetical protein
MNELMTHVIQIPPSSCVKWIDLILIDLNAPLCHYPLL